jgi:hypothetical protein
MLGDVGDQVYRWVCLIAMITFPSIRIIFWVYLHVTGQRKIERKIETDLTTIIVYGSIVPVVCIGIAETIWP